ncbi:MAG: sulfatase, partial [Halobacteriales archaeon]
GDHGEEFMEHGHLAHYPKLYDELVHVPLVIEGPGIEPSIVEHHVGLDAIPPTVCDLLDVPAPERWTGESLVPAMKDAEGPRDDPVISVAVRGGEITQQPIPRALSEGELLVSGRDADWTFIEHSETGHQELYHRPSDPEQQQDLSASPDPAAEAALDRLRPAVRAHADRLSGPGTAGDDDRVADGLAQQLEALGYK